MSLKMKDKPEPLDVKIVGTQEPDSLYVTMNPYQFWILIGAILFVGVLK